MLFGYLVNLEILVLDLFLVFRKSLVISALLAALEILVLDGTTALGIALLVFFRSLVFYILPLESLLWIFIVLLVTGMRN